MYLKISKKGLVAGLWDTVREKSLLPRGTRCVTDRAGTRGRWVGHLFSVVGCPLIPFASEHSVDLCVG